MLFDESSYDEFSTTVKFLLTLYNLHLIKTWPTIERYRIR